MAGEKSRLQILMDLKKAEDQAAKLDEAAKAIKKEADRFTDCRADISQAWEGTNATNFMSKMGLVSEDLNKVADKLKKTAGVIRDNALTIYKAEMEAKRIADIRNHS